jgi:hypothetical protein
MTHKGLSKLESFAGNCWDRLEAERLAESQWEDSLNDAIDRRLSDEENNAAFWRKVRAMSESADAARVAAKNKADAKADAKASRKALRNLKA